MEWVKEKILFFIVICAIIFSVVVIAGLYFSGDNKDKCQPMMITNKEIVGSTSITIGKPYVYDINGNGWVVSLDTYGMVSKGYSHNMIRYSTYYLDGVENRAKAC